MMFVGYYSAILKQNWESYGFLNLIYKTRAADFDGLKIWHLQVIFMQALDELGAYRSQFCSVFKS